jgi:hypothetical protein
MKRIARLITFLLLCVSLGFGIVGIASAATCSTTTNPLECACGAGGGATGSDTCKTNGSDPIGGPNGVLKKVSILIAFMAGVVAVIVLIFGGLMFVVANGDAQKAANARKMVLGAVVGLVIIAASETILIFVVSKL